MLRIILLPLEHSKKKVYRDSNVKFLRLIEFVAEFDLIMQDLMKRISHIIFWCVSI